jgi:hypothetical protein
MFVPLWLAIPLLAGIGLALLWLALILAGRNPLPFPDVGSRIFSAASPDAKAALVALLAQYGVRERFEVNTSGVLRSIMWDGTIINLPDPAIVRRLGGATASIGLVVADPASSAGEAAAFLKARGFSAEVVLDAEPELPIAFVVSNAFSGTVLNFRKHVIHLPRPTSRSAPT